MLWVCIDSCVGAKPFTEIKATDRAAAAAEYFYGNIGGGSDICHGEQVRVLCKKSGGGERSYIENKFSTVGREKPKTTQKPDSRVFFKLIPTRSRLCDSSIELMPSHSSYGTNPTNWMIV
eukprot:scaffold3169_cov117-Skeletonema_dohrnii-CCMP3373.AAC.12